MIDQLEEVQKRNELQFQNILEFEKKLNGVTTEIINLKNVYENNNEEIKQKLCILENNVIESINTMKQNEIQRIEDQYKILLSSYNTYNFKYFREKQFKTLLDEKEINQLEEWTGLKCSDIIFNSDVDNWKIDTSVFNERIIGKKQLIFLIEEIEGEKFGYYLNTEIVENHDKKMKSTDSNSFHFNLESKDNRLNGPKRFEIKDQRVGYYLYTNSNKRLLFLGNIIICKENDKNESYYVQNNDQFDYHGIENALCRKSKTEDERKIYFIPKRILVIQMI